MCNPGKRSCQSTQCSWLGRLYGQSMWGLEPGYNRPVVSVRTEMDVEKFKWSDFKAPLPRENVKSLFFFIIETDFFICSRLVFQYLRFNLLDSLLPSFPIYLLNFRHTRTTPQSLWIRSQFASTPALSRVEFWMGWTSSTKGWEAGVGGTFVIRTNSVIGQGPLEPKQNWNSRDPGWIVYPGNRRSPYFISSISEVFVLLFLCGWTKKH